MIFAPIVVFIAMFQNAGERLVPLDECSRIRELIANKNLQEAQTFLNSSAATSPACEEGHILMAQTYLAERQYEKANAEGLAAFKMKESFEAFLLLATANMEMRKLNESIQWLQRASTAYPERPEIYKILGLDYALGGMMAESAGAFQAAAKLDMKNWEYPYMEGRALTEMAELKHAEAALHKATALGGPVTKIEAALGQVYERAHQDDAAEHSYQKAVEGCGGNGTECGWGLLDLGILISRNRGFAEGEPWLIRAAQARPDWGKPHFYLGKALAARKDLAHACIEFEAAARLDHEKSEYHYDLAQTYRDLGRTTDAAREFALFRKTAASEKRTLSSVDLR